MNDSPLAQILYQLFGFAVTVALAWWLLRALVRSLSRAWHDGARRASDRDRLLDLEERIEAVADDAMRLDEAQRHQAELLATRQAESREGRGTRRVP